VGITRPAVRAGIFRNTCWPPQTEQPHETDQVQGDSRNDGIYRGSHLFHGEPVQENPDFLNSGIIARVIGNFLTKRNEYRAG